MICPHCHATIKDHSKFCSVCGSKIPQTEERSTAVMVNPRPVGASSDFLNQLPNTVGQIQGMMPKTAKEATGDNRFLLLMSGILWLVPVLGTFVNTIKFSSGGMTMGFSLFGITDLPNIIPGADTNINSIFSAMKTWLVIYVIAILAIAIFALWQALKVTSSKKQVIYSFISIPFCSVLLMILNSVNNIFSAVSMIASYSSASTGYIGLSFFGWLVIIALFLIFVANFFILWNLAKKVQD